MDKPVPAWSQAPAAIFAWIILVVVIPLAMIEGHWHIWRRIISVLLFAAFVCLVHPGEYQGYWWHDTGKMMEQGFDISGDRPPLYPMLLRVVGRKIIYPQMYVAVGSWCLLGFVLAGLPGLVIAGLAVISPWFARWHGCLLTESFSLSFAALVVAFGVLFVNCSERN